MRRAVFLDRDGTLVLPKHYPSRPEELVLYEDIAPRLVKLQSAGFRLIVVTNQSGLAYGYFDAAALERMTLYLSSQLSKLGVQIDAIYHCPHHPNGTIPALAVACTCRKPAPGMLLRAAAEWALDLARCWMVGDILHDVEAGNRAGCRTVLVDNGGETEWVDGPFRQPESIVADTAAALDLIISREGLAPLPHERIVSERERSAPAALTLGAPQ